jgi:putative oxidoreductase
VNAHYQEINMSNHESFVSTWSPRLLSVLRIVAALLFMEHGSQKLLGFPPSAQPFHFPIFSMPGLAGVLELFGGLLLLVGLFTRPVALILSGEMAVAYFMVHLPQNFWPILNKGELAILYCFVFLYFVAAGAGVWSIDYQWRRSETVAGSMARIAVT